MKTLSTQAQELGQSAAKIVMDAAKPKVVIVATCGRFDRIII